MWRICSVSSVFVTSLFFIAQAQQKVDMGAPQQNR